MTTDQGAFYSALDADSDGEEGKYYVWKKEEIDSLLGDDNRLMRDYFNVNAKGFWEHGNHILLRDESDADFAAKHDLTVEDLRAKVDNSRDILFKAREENPAWFGRQATNLLECHYARGYVDAYRVFRKAEYLAAAEKNADFILKTQRKKDGGLWHSHKEGRSRLTVFSRIMATIEALLALYQATFERKHLEAADELAAYTIKNFKDEERNVLFNSNEDAQLIARKWRSLIT